MAYILSIETATTICSAALHLDGVLLSERIVSEERSHSKVLNQLMLQVLDEGAVKIDQLNAIAVSKGPGSYTGLRIGVATAKGVCFANEIPLIGVNTLQTMASAIDVSKYSKEALLCPMIDARRMEVYLNFYNAFYEPEQDTSAVIIEQGIFNEKLSQQEIVFFGNGMNKCKEVLEDRNAKFEEGIEPLARHMGVLAFNKFKNDEFENLAYFEPFYLKDFRITPSKK